MSDLNEIARAMFNNCPSPVSGDRFPAGFNLKGRMAGREPNYKLTYDLTSTANADLAASFLGLKMNILLTKKFLSAIGKVTWSGTGGEILMVGRPSADRLRDLGVPFDPSAIIDTVVPYDVEVNTTDEDGEPDVMNVEHYKYLTSNVLYGDPGAVQVYVDLNISEADGVMTLDAVFQVDTKARLGRYVEVE